MHKSTRLEIGWAVFSVFIGLIYGVVSFVYADASFQASVTNGLLIALLSTAVSLLIILINLHTQAKDRLDALQQGDEQAADSVKRLHDETRSAHELLQKVLEDKKRFALIRACLFSRNELVKNAGMQTLTNYVSDFKVTSSGFSVRGEQWALHAYTRLWEGMTRMQQAIGKDPDRCIIARVTHSNDIRLWSEEVHNSFYLIELQKRFIDAGGVIVRIFVGPDDEPDERYVQVMSEMKAKGIDARYVCQKQVAQFPYDFLCLHDEGIVSKWYSGADGRALGMCEIQDRVGPLIEERWNVLAGLTLDRYGEVEVIPKHRHIGINGPHRARAVNVQKIAQLTEARR